MWECLCDCGNIVNVAGSALKNGNTKSCGCYKREMDKKYTAYKIKSIIHMIYLVNMELDIRKIQQFFILI